MRINRTGVTRIVFVFSRVVVKIPNFLSGWRPFVSGVLSNINERDCWNWNSGKYEKGRSHLLCPVLWSSWGAWFVVMRKVDKVLTMEEGWEHGLEEHMKYFSGDDKGPNYGVLEGRVVKIDYGYVYIS